MRVKIVGLLCLLAFLLSLPSALNLHIVSCTDRILSAMPQWRARFKQAIIIDLTVPTGASRLVSGLAMALQGKLVVDHIVSDSGHSPEQLQDLLYCTPCTRIFHNSPSDVIAGQITSWCPRSLDEIPLHDISLKGNRSRNWFGCPDCSS